MTKKRMFAALRLATALTAASLAALDTAWAQTPATVLHQPARALPGDVRVTRAQDAVTIDWPSGTGERAQLVLSLDRSKPLIGAVSIAGKPVLGGIDPAGVVTVGTRDLKEGWTIFFDNPRQRPFESFPLTLARDDITVRAEGGYTRVIVGGAAAGPFSGTYQFTLYPGSRLVRAAMVMSTQRPATAYTFDAGLSVASSAPLPWRAVAFTGLDDAVVRKAGEESRKPAVSPKVRARMIVAEGSAGGALGILPPPHQFYYPLDYANNDNSAWYGSDYRNLTGRTGWASARRSRATGAGCPGSTPRRDRCKTWASSCCPTAATPPASPRLHWPIPATTASSGWPGTTLSPATIISSTPKPF